MPILKHLLLVFACLSALIIAPAQLLDDSSPLVEQAYFGGKFRIQVPEILIDTALDAEKAELLTLIEEDLGKRKMEDATGTVFLSLDERDPGLSKKTIRNITENMATGFYRGTIYRNEELEIEGVEVFVLDMVGYWNGAKEPSAMLFLVAFGEAHTYDLTFRYPEEYFDYTDGLKEEMIYSIRIREE